MKAKARILILLISMVSYTGFGYSTPDLIQNSEVVTVSTYDVGIDNVIALQVEVNQVSFVKEKIKQEAMSFVKSFIIKSETPRIQEANLQTLLSEQMKPPLKGNQGDTYNYRFTKNKNPKAAIVYRQARDGLRTIRS